MRYMVAITIWLASASLAHAGLLFVSNNDDEVFTIDTDTLEINAVGSLGVDFRWSGLAYDPTRDILFGIDGRGGQFELYSINMETGAATSIGDHGIEELFGLAYDSSTDSLYATQLHGDESLYEIDPDTAVATLVGPLTNSPGIGGLAYDSSRDQLIGFHDFSGEIYEINRSTGEATLLVDHDNFSDGGLAYDPDKDLIWGVTIVDDGILFYLDPDDGYSLTNNVLTNLEALGSSPTGLAYVPTGRTTPVPTTSTWSFVMLLLVISGVAWFTLLRRRRQPLQH